MDAGASATGDLPLRPSTLEIVDLASDDESSIDDASVREEPERKDASEQVNAVGDDPDESDGSDEGCLWDCESLYEDALEGLGDEQLCYGEPGACTLEEAIAYRQQLRTCGTIKFLMDTIESQAITAKKLCTAFGIRPPTFLEGAPDTAYHIFLHLGIKRELQKRAKLVQYNTIDDAVKLLEESKNIIVITGAGISTSLGIPDFRSKETGLYSNLTHLGLSDPQEVFEIKLFREDPSIFYSVAKDILPSTDKFSPTHAFIHLLQEKGKLLTNYTQNIDNLEIKAGIREDKLIQCHGSFASASCIKCRYQVEGQTIFDDVKAGKVPKCPRCLIDNGSSNGSKKRKRGAGQNEGKRNRSTDSSDDEAYDIPEPGVMKPDITFFGESLPDPFHDRLANNDHGLVDLVITIGTSLKVAPVSEVVSFLPPNVPQIYISREPVSHVNFDLDLLGDCDVVVAELCRRLNWELKHEMIPEGQKVDIQLQDGYQSRHLFRVIK